MTAGWVLGLGLAEAGRSHQRESHSGAKKRMGCNHGGGKNWLRWSKGQEAWLSGRQKHQPHVHARHIV